MFRIPNFYQEDVNFAVASDCMSRFGGGDLLAGMQKMNTVWSDYVNLPGEQQDDDEFFSYWRLEVNAYNVVYEGMAQLFGPKRG
jgi:hypothetical protein